MTTPFVCERVERRHPQEKCASKCASARAGTPPFAALFSLPSSIF